MVYQLLHVRVFPDNSDGTGITAIIIFDRRTLKHFRVYGILDIVKTQLISTLTLQADLQ